MTDSRWLQELTNAYINKSAGVPSNINEELITEQGQYISELEDIIITVAESLEVSVEDLMEALNEAKQNTSFSDASAKRKAEQAARQAAMSAKNKERLAGIAAEKKAKYFPKPEKKKMAAAKASGKELASVKLSRVKQVDEPTKPVAVDGPTKPVTEEDWSIGHVKHSKGIIQKPSDRREHLVPITQAHHEAHHAYETLKTRASANRNNPEYQRQDVRRDRSIIDRSKVTPENPRGDSGPDKGLDDTWRETKPEWIAAKENLDRHNNLRERALRDATQRETDKAVGRHATKNAYPSNYDLEAYLGKVDHPLRRDNTPEMRETFGKFTGADHGKLTPYVSHYDKIQAHVDSLPAHVRAAREAHPEAGKIMREKARLANVQTDSQGNKFADSRSKQLHATNTAKNQKEYLDLFTVTKDTIKTKQRGMRLAKAKQRGRAARARSKRMG